MGKSLSTYIYMLTITYFYSEGQLISFSIVLESNMDPVCSLPGNAVLLNNTQKQIR